MVGWESTSFIAQVILLFCSLSPGPFAVMLKQRCRLMSDDSQNALIKYGHSTQMWRREHEMVKNGEHTLLSLEPSFYKILFACSWWSLNSEIFAFLFLCLQRPSAASTPTGLIWSEIDVGLWRLFDSYGVFSGAPFWSCSMVKFNSPLLGMVNLVLVSIPAFHVPSLWNVTVYCKETNFVHARVCVCVLPFMVLSCQETETCFVRVWIAVWFHLVCCSEGIQREQLLSSLTIKSPEIDWASLSWSTCLMVHIGHSWFCTSEESRRSGFITLLESQWHAC